ncbi:hypothetical protein A3K78_01945 [Candidatus Bathyarchaeota archaeon RBG_13_52_12]|nr:MAG: hypothetical protein A3K78_01945 [Candidatus Bathyarchaeota archaeon RBG_13_52_12]
MGFTHYLIFGDAKKALTMEESKKAWAEYSKALVKNNLKLMGPWGPFGEKEGVAFMLEGTIKNFESYINSEAWQKCPIINTRTISLWKMPFS